MREILMWTKAILGALGAVVGAVVLVVLARPLMILGIALAVVAAVWCSLGPRFAQWFESLGEKPHDTAAT